MLYDFVISPYFVKFAKKWVNFWVNYCIFVVLYVSLQRK